MSMRPYIVAAVFGVGSEAKLFTNALLAPSPPAAAAAFVARAVQEMNLAEPLSGVAVVEIGKQFLEDALRAVRNETAEGGQIVTLVPPPGAA